MKTKLFQEEENLVKISMSPAQYQTAKTGEDEMEWQGSMYDVARVEISTNRILVFALRDEAETNLVAFLKSLVNTAQKDDASPPASLTQFTSLIFTLPAEFDLSTLFSVIDNTHFIFFQIHPYSIVAELATPPPKY